MKISSIIFLLSTLLQIGFSEEQVEYKLDNFKAHGTPYVRLRIPESLIEWTCFNEDTYQNIIYLKMDSPIKDSLLNVLSKEVVAYQKQVDDFEKQLAMKNQNEEQLKQFSDNAFSKYRTCGINLSDEKPKKWLWGTYGLLVGSLVGIVSTLYLTH
jgi:hypothetical protein